MGMLWGSNFDVRWLPTLSTFPYMHSGPISPYACPKVNSLQVPYHLLQLKISKTNTFLSISKITCTLHFLIPMIYTIFLILFGLFLLRFSKHELDIFLPQCFSMPILCSWINAIVSWSVSLFNPIYSEQRVSLFKALHYLLNYKFLHLPLSLEPSLSPWPGTYTSLGLSMIPILIVTLLPPPQRLQFDVLSFFFYQPKIYVL